MTFALRRNECHGQSVKFLGINIDAGLTWHAHGDKLSGKLSSAIFVLRTLSGSVSEHTLRIAYYSIFQSHLLYGLLAWGHSSVVAKIFGLQRRAVRVVAGLGYRSECRQAFIRNKILTLPCLYILETVKYVTSNFDDYRNSGEHGYDTRNATQIRHKWLRLTRSRNGINYYGVKLYNAIDERQKELSSKTLLNRLKTYLIGKAFYSIDEFLLDPLTNEWSP